MKITVIHNVYKENPFIYETIDLNVISLINCELDFQYLVFNDCGDESIKNNIEKNLYDLYSNRYIDYYYSKTNYGQKVCTGGWIGAEKENIIWGDVVHNIGQDDVITEYFYRQVKDIFEKEKDIMFITSNGYKVSENLSLQDILIHPQAYFEYRKPLNEFKQWFGIQNGIVTRANNNMLASGTLYKRELHNTIGLPDIEFGGAMDFEYWSRILYNGIKGHYINMPCWYYRMSNYSAGNEIIDGKPNRGYWQQEAIKKIQKKYSKLVEQNKEKLLWNY